MRIATRNIIAENSSIVMTNTDPNYPVENVYSNMLEEVMQAAGNTTVITVSFNTDQVVDVIFFGFHNASTATFVFKDIGGSTLDTIVFTTPQVYAKDYINKLDTVRSIEITLSTSEAYLLIGNLFCGEYTQLHNMRLPMTVEHVDTSVFGQTYGGQFLYRTGITLQSFNVDCDKLPDDKLAEFELAYSKVHKGKTWWMDRNEELDTQIFVAFDANYHTTRRNELTDLSFSIKESR